MNSNKPKTSSPSIIALVVATYLGPVILYAYYRLQLQLPSFGIGFGWIVTFVIAIQAIFLAYKLRGKA